MSASTARFMEIFLEVFEALPRQGPGNRASAERALALCSGLPTAPAVLDLGCGVGGQTLYLAELTGGTIVAVDEHAPFIQRLGEAVAGRGLAHRVQPVAADMAALDLTPGSFDLIWSEGALYNLGIAPALEICRRLLRPGGYLVFTDAVWTTEDRPEMVRAAFEDYPTMGTVPDMLETIARGGFEIVEHFTLPNEAWWEDFYTPMLQRVEELQSRYAGDEEALAILEQIAQEPEMHRQHSDTYAYEFFITRSKE